MELRVAEGLRVSGAAPSPEAEAEAAEERAALLRALTSLPDDDRQVIACRHLLQLSVEETANALDLPEGTVYPALHRLERRGLLKSGWTSVDGRRRRVYRLTSSGRRELESKAREWRAFARVVDGVLP